MAMAHTRLSRLLRAGIPLLSLVAIACGGELEEQYNVDRLRVLGVVAEPPGVAYGESVELTPIIARGLERTESLHYEWQVCLFSGGIDTFFACPEAVGDVPFPNILAQGNDPTLTFDQDFLDPDSLEALCAALDEVASSPDLPPGLTLPKCGSGLPATVRVKVCEETPGCDDLDAEIATRTLTLVRDEHKDRADRNQNPEILSLSVDGILAQEDGSTVITLTKAKDQDLELLVDIPRSSIQRYTPTRPPGEEVSEREEDLRLSWHVTVGDFFKSQGFYMEGKATYEELLENKVSFDLSEITLPTEIRFWLVLRDNRGGYGWLERSVQLVDGR